MQKMWPSSNTSALFIMQCFEYLTFNLIVFSDLNQVMINDVMIKRVKSWQFWKNLESKCLFFSAIVKTVSNCVSDITRTTVRGVVKSKFVLVISQVMIFLLIFEKTVQVLRLAKGELAIMRVVIWMASITVEFVWQLMSLKIVAGRFGQSEMEIDSRLYWPCYGSSGPQVIYLFVFRTCKNCKRPFSSNYLFACRTVDL